MHIVFFHRKMKSGWQSIEGSFAPLIQELSKEHKVEVYHVPFSEGWPIQAIRNVLFIKKHACSDGINHITGDIHYGILGMINKVTVLTIHDDYSVVRAKHGWLDKLYRWIFWIYLPIKYCNAPICTTLLNLKKIKKLYNSSKLKYITHLHPSNSFVYLKKDFNKINPRILQVGTENNKNLETTLKVIKGIKCHLVVLKKMTDSQRKFAEENDIDFENKCDIPFSEVISEYQKADIVTFPSLYEGFGLPIVEAQASGRPIITSNIEPMNWVAGDGAVLLDNPLDVEEYRNALEKLINDDDFRNQLVAKGIENSKRFTLKSGVQQYEALYKDLCIQNNLPL